MRQEQNRKHMSSPSRGGLQRQKQRCAVAEQSCGSLTMLQVPVTDRVTHRVDARQRRQPLDALLAPVLQHDAQRGVDSGVLGQRRYTGGIRCSLRSFRLSEARAQVGDRVIFGGDGAAGGLQVLLPAAQCSPKLGNFLLPALDFSAECAL